MSKRLRKIVTVTVLTTSMILSSSVMAFAQSSTPTEFQNEVVQHMKNRETNFSITYTGDSNTFISQASALIKNAMKSDEYLDLSWTKQSSTAQGTNGNLTVSFNVGYITTLQQEQVVDQKVPQIISQIITPGMTDLKKAQAIHEYVCKITSYDYSLVKNSAYNALVDGQTVCRGYALLMYRLYTEAGIPNHLVVGTLKGVSHAWNMVQLGGKWYHVDATNDDANNFAVFYGMSDTTARGYGFAWTQGTLPYCTSNLATDIATALPNATKAVTNAETYKTQIYVDGASKLVSMLADGTDKTSLLQRLQVVQDSIIQADTTAVVNAETTKTQTSINSALSLVNQLPSSDTKTTLLNRLQVVQQGIYLNSATTAVVNAEKYVNQTYVTTATKALSLLNDSSDKTALVSRLQVVSDKILETATNAVIKAETSLLIADVNSANTLVNALPTGDSKTNLVNRLNTVRLTIQVNNATTSVINAEKALTKSTEQSAEVLVNALPSNDTKTSLLNRLSIVKTTIVTNAVVVAETTPNQTNINNANNLLSLIPTGDIKTDLINRIQVVQQKVYLNNATVAVTNAEKYFTQSYVDVANKALTLVSEGDSKTDLMNRLQIVSETMVTNATNAVSKAEESLLTVDVLSADKLISVLPTGTIKTGLTTRLTTVKQTIAVNNATAYVVKAESSLLPTDLLSANGVVNSLTTSDSKTALLNRLTTVRQTIATNYVTKAETSLLITDVNIATSFVNGLNTGDVKTSLLNRLITVKETIATNAVVKAETSILQVDINTASNLISFLPTGDVKTALTTRLNAVKQALPLANATRAVVSAESFKTQISVNAAFSLVNGLPASNSKLDLTSRLNTVQQSIYLANATIAVVNAEKYKTLSYITTAKTLIAKLNDCTEKKELSDRISAIS